MNADNAAGRDHQSTSVTMHQQATTGILGPARRVLFMIALATFLGACGGGGDYNSPPPPPAPPAPTDAVPASASTSSAGLKDYLVALSTASADDKEPVSLATFTPVLPDDTEPEVVN